MLDAPSTEVSNGHCQNFVNCVLMGANNASASGERVTRIGLGKPTTNVVHISGNNSGNSDYVISNIHAQSGTTAVRDEINSVTLTGPFVALYSWSKNATSGLTNLVTTDTTIPNRFPTGIGTGLAPTGSSPTNTDLAGQCLMGSACSGFGGTQYTFKHAYANPPICTCTDVSGVHTCNLTVTALRSHSPGQPLTRSTTSA